jgi:hypothetical protein
VKRWLAAIVLLWLCLCAGTGHAVELNVGQPVWLPYSLVDADGDYIDTGVDQLSCWYMKAGSHALVEKSLSEFNWIWVGYGLYEIFFTDDELDTEGVFVTQLIYSGGAIDRHRDILVNQAVRWEGDDVSVFTLDASETPLPGCNVRITNLTRTIFIDQGITNTDGRVDFKLAAGTYLAQAWGTGRDFPAPDTLVVVGNMSFIIRGEEFIPEVPSVPTMANVYGWLIAADGVARSDVIVTFALQAPGATRPVLTSEHRVVTRTVLRDTTDAEGGFSIDLIPPSAMTPSGLRYKVTFSDDPADVAYIGRGMTGGEAFDLDDLIH